jgi:hypothetical protein
MTEAGPFADPSRPAALRGSAAIAVMLPLLILALLIGPVAARAEDKPEDAVSLELSAEGWVDTKTARVVAVIDAGGTAEQLAGARADIQKTLVALAKDGEWHMTRFDRSQDPAGLERWRVEAETRLPEAALGGLADRARTASKPGQQVRIAAVDFTPTLAEREDAVASLRSLLYRRAADEAKRASEGLPGKPYRVRQIDFAIDGGPGPVPMQMRAAMAKPGEAVSADAGQGAAVSQRLTLRARVTLAAGL